MVLSTAQTRPAPAGNAAEVTTRETPASFKSKVNLVLVPVVVRDRQGRTVGNLRREDFQLFDRGKPQAITNFSVEKSGVAAALAQQSTAPEAPKTPPPEGADRFVAYLFDDMHADFASLSRLRAAAERHLGSSLGASDRAAVFTTSGQTMLDFTDDTAKLREELGRIGPRSMATPAAHARCPPEVNHYVADLIENKKDQEALNFLSAQELACGATPDQYSAKALGAIAAQQAKSDAASAFAIFDRESRMALNTLKDVVRRISTMPGRRMVIFASPGFLTLDNQFDKGGIIDLAIRSGVVVSTLDARGLYGVPGMDASREGDGINTSIRKDEYDRMNEALQDAVLAEIADGTGGTFFHNNNDLAEGFRLAGARPEYLYVLAFSPQNLKLDGNFHALKVAVKEPKGLSTQARRGYYAPTHLEDAAEQAKREIEEALFSRDEIRELPVELHTQFFKSSDAAAKLAVLVRVDVKQLQFRKAEGRNSNDVTIVSALFDRNGNYITGLNKVLILKLKDETLQARLSSGLTVKNSFDVKPGSYVIRLVVRDSEGQLMAAQNGAVEIP
ncbi:MAG TPA: VWA domain-containing protein [Bryobacteraceae bacterium]